MKAKFNAAQKQLTLVVDIDQAKQSRSGNSTVIASTRGQQYIGKIDGRDTYLQLNVMQMEASGGAIEVEGVGEDARPTRRVA